MSQFTGGKLKVRCVDCTKLSTNHCTAKNIKVAPKKKRLCTQYNFKGEFENRTPSEAVYMPHVDQKTRKMIKRLLNTGIIPVSADGSMPIKDRFSHIKTLPMPATTATSPLIQIENPEGTLASETETSDSKLIWTPDDA